MIPENVYGSRKRLQWVCSQISERDRVVDLGCGTGVMLTIPLARMGYDIVGYDHDRTSVEYGKRVLMSFGMPEDRVRVGSIDEVPEGVDVIIASELLEHLRRDQIDTILRKIHAKLRGAGLLLITVPNGRGWFEWESFAWRRLGLRLVFEPTRIASAVTALKRIVLGRHYCVEHPATFDFSPHVQKFNYDGIKRILEGQGYRVDAIQGSVLVCGPVSNLLFTGMRPVMRLNNWLGSRFPRLAAGMYVRARPTR